MHRMTKRGILQKVDSSESNKCSLGGQLPETRTRMMELEAQTKAEL